MPNDPAEAELRLERLVHRTLRELPLRRAPPTLESLVLGELRRRAALPWWRRSFYHWPKGARAAFASMCVALAGLGFVGGAWTLDGVRSLNASWALARMPSARAAGAIMAASQESAAALARAIPADWIYGGLALSAALYAALFGLGVAAYRTLYLNSALPGERT